MATKARKLDIAIDTEETIGTEDRVFLDTDGRWWWQARGSVDCVGPFGSRDEAVADYDAT